MVGRRSSSSVAIQGSNRGLPLPFRLAPDSSAFDFPSSSAQDSLDESLPDGLVLQSGDGLSVVTLRGRILLWNEVAEEQLGIPREQAVGSFLADVSRTP